MHFVLYISSGLYILCQWGREEGQRKRMAERETGLGGKKFKVREGGMSSFLLNRR